MCFVWPLCSLRWQSSVLIRYLLWWKVPIATLMAGPVRTWTVDAIEKAATVWPLGVVRDVVPFADVLNVLYEEHQCFLWWQSTAESCFRHFSPSQSGPLPPPLLLPSTTHLHCDHISANSMAINNNKFRKCRRFFQKYNSDQTANKAKSDIACFIELVIVFKYKSFINQVR